MSQTEPRDPRGPRRESAKAAVLRRRWLFFSITGLILVGAGVSVVGEAILLKGGGAPGPGWFLLGTLGLVILNSGISFFGQGVLEKAKLDRLG